MVLRLAAIVLLSVLCLAQDQLFLQLVLVQCHSLVLLVPSGAEALEEFVVADVELADVIVRQDV